MAENRCTPWVGDEYEFVVQMGAAVPVTELADGAVEEMTESEERATDGSDHKNLDDYDLSGGDGRLDYCNHFHHPPPWRTTFEITVGTLHPLPVSFQY